MPSKLFIGIASLSVAGLFTAQAADTGAAPASGQGVQITELADRVRVEINGELFTEYHFREVPRPYLLPGHGPRRVGHDAGLADEKQPQRGA